jgi:hypothetical protein
MLKLACEACEKRLHDIEMLRLELDAERKARKESDKLKSEANYRLSENAEALKARAELLASENAELRMQVKKAEAEVKDLTHDRAFLIAWLKSEGIKVKVGGKCEREGAGSEITIGSNTPLWEAEAKLAGYERRPNCETCAVSDCPTCGQQGLPFCSKYKPNRKQRGKHFPDKKADEKPKQRYCEKHHRELTDTGWCRDGDHYPEKAKDGRPSRPLALPQQRDSIQRSRVEGGENIR